MTVAAHVWKQKHATDHKLVLLKQASNKQELTNSENILKTKSKDHVINFEIPSAYHLTKKFILNPVEGSRSAPTRSSNKISRSRVDNGDKVPESASLMFKQVMYCVTNRFL